MNRNKYSIMRLSVPPDVANQGWSTAGLASAQVLLKSGVKYLQIYKSYLLNNIINDNYKKCEDEIKPKTSILLLSSLFFITNMITAFFNQYYLYSFLFFILTITSFLVHYNNNIYTNIIDKIAILSIILYGSYVLYNKININKWINYSIIIITFMVCIYLYIYGFIVNDYCFNNEKNIAENYHFIMHIISSIGHHLIIFL
jgi:hypothetical protein